MHGVKAFDKLGVFVSPYKTVYNVATLKSFMNHIAALGYNALYLDISGGFEIEDEPMFCYLRARYSGAEMRELDAYGARLGITVIPAIQTLAHIDHLFKWEIYRDLRDIDDILLAGEQRVYLLIEKMIRTMKECFSSGVIHLGMDEAFNLGRGRYCDLHGAKDKADILKEHVGRVLDIVRRYGLKAEMWGDMYVRLAYGGYDESPDPFVFDRSDEVSKIVPQDVMMYYWDYFSTDEEHYRYFFDKFAALTSNVAFAAGVHSYIGFNPDNTYSIKATEAAFRVCMERGVRQAIVTLWGGNGNESSIWSAMPTLTAAAEFAKGSFSPDAVKKAFRKVMGADFDSFIDLELADKLKPYDSSNTDRSRINPTKYFLYNDPFSGRLDTTVDESEKSIFTAAAAKLAKHCKNRRWGYVFRTSEALAEVAELKFDLGVRTRRLYKAGDKAGLRAIAADYTELIKRIKKLYSCFKRSWFTENKPQGFEVHDVRFGGNLMRLAHCREMLLDYCDGKTERIEELETELRDVHDGGTEFRKGAVQENWYTDTVSVNIL